MGKDRRATLLRVGERLFRDHGYRAVSIRDITTAAGLGMGSFYTYFTGKPVFYAAVLDALEERVVHEVEKRIKGLYSATFKLGALFRATCAGIRGEPILRGLHSAEGRYLYPGWEKRARTGPTVLTRVRGLVSQILAEGTRKGEFRTSIFQDPDLMLAALIAAVPVTTPAAQAESLIADFITLAERGLKRWLRFRQRDERRDVRARHAV